MISIILTTCCQNEYRLSLLKVSTKNFLRHTVMHEKQWIICDNGDERQTEYLKTLKPNKHLIFGENRGIAYARNAGAEEATGNYLCFIDGDLVYRPFWLSTLRNLLIKFKDRKLIATGHFGEMMRMSRRRCVEAEQSYQVWQRSGCGCLLMSRETWNDVRPWPDWWRIGAAFCVNIGEKGYHFIVPIPDVARPLDYSPSYDKKLLAETCKSGKPEWKMLDVE